ncbi:GL10532 [Drosophila persimilis]|uniref:GL10532 n=1 Tax=Drosophila persimilis TaxID=7234 RepID=B4GBE5_DROPE|nr:GL10532 [Drosophila persimilis]
MCRSLTSQHGSQRRKKSRLSSAGNEDSKKSGSLHSAFQMYSPFSSKENLESGDDMQAARLGIVRDQDSLGTDAQPSDSIIMPLCGELNTINAILEEEAESVENKTSESIKETTKGPTTTSVDSGRHEDDVSGQKGRGDDSSGSGRGGSNRIKRNLKHTGSLIVRKLTAFRHGGSDKKGASRTSTISKEPQVPPEQHGQHPVAKEEEKPNTKSHVAMLRTTTL